MWKSLLPDLLVPLHHRIFLVSMYNYEANSALSMTKTADLYHVPSKVIQKIPTAFYFEVDNRLENDKDMLTVKRKSKVIYCPKHHCELNAIESLWCDQKADAPSCSDRSFDRMKKLIAQWCTRYVEREIALKLFRRC